MQGRELRRLVEAMVWAMDQESARLRAALERVEAVATAREVRDAEAVAAQGRARTAALEELKVRAQRVLLYAEYVAVRADSRLLDEDDIPHPGGG